MMNYISLGDGDANITSAADPSSSRIRNNISAPSDNAECEHTRTLQYKKIIENFCEDSANHCLEWKLENVIVDTQPSALVNGCPRNIQSAKSHHARYTGRLHTLT